MVGEVDTARGVRGDMATSVTDDFLDHPSWHRAATLAERARARRHGPPSSEGIATDSPLLTRWLAQAPFTNETLRHGRLAVDGLTEEEFARILREPIEGVASRHPGRAPWLEAVKRALALSPSAGPLPLPPRLQAVPTSGFLELVRPFLDEGRARLRETARTLAGGDPAPPFDPEAVDALLAPAASYRLLVMLMRTMVLELNVAKVQGQLSGETSEARFGDFIERLRQPDVRAALLLEYPVLARHVARCIEQWLDASGDLLAHLVADRAAIRAMFSPDADPGPLAGIEMNVSDPHRGGRAVAILTFRSGLKLVYKPKSLAVDVHFQELLAWLNASGASPPLRVIRVLDRGDHGWAEFVQREPCASAEQVERFYARQGENLALLYVLGASDFHFENLIAAGEHPVLVDLEALFRPRMTDEIPATLVHTESVLRTNLLPMRLGAHGEYAGMDISGLGSPEGKLTASKVQDWDDRYQDTMRFVRRRVPMRGGHNQPMLGRAPVEADAYLGALRAGFDAMYRLIASRRDELAAPGGPIDRFAHDPIRLIMRDTSGYLLLLGEAVHPDALRDALEHDRVLDHLWAVVPHAPYMLPLVEAERAALARYDVPLFSAWPDSLDLEADGARFPGLVATPGLDVVKQRLARMGERDRARQQWCIDAAFASMAGGADPGERAEVPGAVAASARGSSLREQCLAAAGAVGEQLAALAFVEGEVIGWHGIRQIDERHWTIAFAGLDLYGGLPGIALFFAQLQRLTGDDRHAALTRGIVATLRRTVDAVRSTFRPIGAFTGWGGVIYALVHLAHLLDDPDLLGDAAAVAAILPPLIAADEDLDVVGGAAGCLGGLLCLQRVAPSTRVLTAAVACGERLLARAREAERGLGWPTRIAPERPLCGFSHGAAGIGWALYELAAATGEARFQTAAEGAFAYERRQLETSGKTWPDLRGPVGEGGAPATRFTTAWCHGAPGIGLSRVRALVHASGDVPALRAEIAHAVAATVAGGFGHNHSLCHGDLGNLELLLQVARIAPEPATLAELERCQTKILDDIERHGFQCATPRAVVTPGLMLGLAGIGYGLLRLADPTRVPSVLLLEGPLGSSWSVADTGRPG